VRECPQVRVTAFSDRTFTFETKGPPTSYFLLKAAGLEKGAEKPGYETVGKLSVKHIYEIAKVRPPFARRGVAFGALTPGAPRDPWTPDAPAGEEGGRQPQPRVASGGLQHACR
jgi:hypothetical protein